MAEFEGSQESHDSSTGGTQENEKMGGSHGDSGFAARFGNAQTRIRDSAGQAREFVTEKVDEVSEQVSQYADRVRNMNTQDMDHLWEDMKSHARQNPGQMMIVSAAVGFALGMFMRSGPRGRY